MLCTNDQPVCVPMISQSTQVTYVSQPVHYLPHNQRTLLKRQWVNSQSITEATVCVTILTRRKIQRFIYGTQRQRDHLKCHGTHASTIRTSALVLCYSIAEYTASVWAKSSHDILDLELNKAPKLSHDASRKYIMQRTCICQH